jgi:anti-sigma B factor antagonist
MSKVTKDEGRVVVKPEKDVVASMVNDFRSELQSLVKEQPAEMIIDMDGVNMVDSVGIGVIIATFNSLNKTGGTFTLTNVSKDIFSLFSTMRLDQHFSIEKAG